MKKYFYIFKSELMSNLNYVANNLLSFITYFLFIYIFMNLWKYIYSDPNELINGYSINQMIWYVIITELLWSSAEGRKLCREISNDVRGGNIAYNINKPYNYVLYSLFSHLGEVFIKTIIFTFLAMVVGLLFLGSFPSLNIIGIICVSITYIFATVINTLLIIFIGLFSFFIEDSGPFYWGYSKLILVCGTLFPIEYFPIWVRPTLTYSPIYVVSYGPARLFVNYSWSEFIHIFIAQIIYAFIAYSICLLAYRKGVRKLNVNGG